MSAASQFLERLSGVRETGPGRWVACCPAHSDHRPSLSIRETDGGRVLLYDFGGCAVDAVLGALGLRLSDLFDRPVEHHSAGIKSRVPARDLLDLVSFEVDVAGIILMEIFEGRGVTELSWSRLKQAAQRINRARIHIHG